MLTEALGHFIAETTKEDIPKEALRNARSAITDFIGVCLPGTKDKAGQLMVNLVENMGGLPVAGVIGAGFKTSPYLAALANGTTGHALDYDDAASIVGPFHPSAVIAPAILALGESIGASGMDILAAYVVGFEAAACFAPPIGPKLYEMGWHTTGDAIGGLAAAAAAAHLLGLSTAQSRMAVAIAVSTTSALVYNFGTMTKPLHAGRGAANGVLSALLAEAGFTAAGDVIEAPRGIVKVKGYAEKVDWENRCEKLGKSFAIVSSGIFFKLYPSCAGTHPGIEAALYLIKEHRFRLEEIAEIELGVRPDAANILRHFHPKTGLEGKFSLHYTVARSLVSGKPTLKHFTDEAVMESQPQALIEKMKWTECYPKRDPNHETHTPTKVTIRLRNGDEYRKEIMLAKGCPQNPLTPQELENKYRECASAALSKDKIEKSLMLLENLEELRDIKDLMETVAGHE